MACSHNPSTTLLHQISMVVLVLLAFLCIASGALAQEGRLIPNPIRNIPKWVRTEIAARHLEDRYTINYRLYPYYLRGDFNGDHRKDVAVQAQEKSSGKMGIIIVHQRRPQALSTFIAILGAGQAVGGAGSDFSWANQWGMLTKRHGGKNNQIPPLTGDAIQLAKRDTTSGIIFWNGRHYEWRKLKISTPINEDAGEDSR